MLSAAPDPVETIAFHEWLKSVIEEGQAVLPTAPSTWSRQPRAIFQTIGAYARIEALDLAGPSLALDDEAALWAAEFLAAACWELVSGDAVDRLPVSKVPAPQAPATIFAVDLFFRYLPKVLQRAKALDADGSLVKKLEKALQLWPLSGVLAPGAIKPENENKEHKEKTGNGQEGALDFFGHIGLQQLYAERFFLAPHSAWLPREGTTREWIEAIFAERGVPLPVIPDTSSPLDHE